MANVYRAILRAREDMTEWLIHFTRAGGGTDARGVLLKILAEGALRPGRAVRGGRPTIYGPQPAVCFSEQPLGAFLTYVDARAGDRFGPSSYGVLVHKHDAYVEGALPVIYGLNGAEEMDLDHPDYLAGARQLLPECVPLDEQHRYVAFAPNRDPHPLDWSHEREWRWTPAGYSIEGCFALGGSGTAGGRGMSNGRCHVFVERDQDVEWLHAQLPVALAAAAADDAEGRMAGYRRAWWRNAVGEARVFSLETARRRLNENQRAYYRVETWPENARPYLVEEQE